MDFVYSHRQKWALHGLVRKGFCSCTVVCKRGKRFWGPMCCESKLQPHVKDGSIRKPKRTKQSIYVRCYLNMHAVDFIFLYFFGGGCLICAAGEWILSLLIGNVKMWKASTLLPVNLVLKGIYCIYTFKLSRLSFAFETRKIVSPKWCGENRPQSPPSPSVPQFRWKIPQLATLLRKDSKACFNASWKSCRRCNKSWFLVIERLHNLAAIEI